MGSERGFSATAGREESGTFDALLVFPVLAYALAVASAWWTGFRADRAQFPETWTSQNTFAHVAMVQIALVTIVGLVHFLTMATLWRTRVVMLRPRILAVLQLTAVALNLLGIVIAVRNSPTDETDFRVVIGLYLLVQPLVIALVTIHVAHAFQLRARRAP